MGLGYPPPLPLAGGLGLVIAALGSWTRWPGISLIALVSVLIVLPAAVLYGWQGVYAFWVNTQLGMHYGVWAWGVSHSATVPRSDRGATVVGSLPEIVFLFLAATTAR